VQGALDASFGMGIYERLGEAAVTYSWGLASILFICVPCATAAERTKTTSDLPASFVFLRDVAPNIAQDIRYATPLNFTLGAIPGYGAAECILAKDAAAALKLVQEDLRAQGLSLKVYDCYRPMRAVHYFNQWVRAGSKDGDDTSYFPSIRREDLVQLGYIAPSSSHSRGDTVDVTLIATEAKELDKPGPLTRYGPCTGPAEERFPDNSVDMGTGFDCFDAKSNTNNSALTSTQKRWREKLVTAMTGRGFKNYPREWWHFTFGSGKGPTFDFPISPRPPP
jgi:D-alanyl-D-alanine dipeptidase